MKKIVLLGDSIRMGYDKYTKTAFEGVSEVFYPTENCRYAENMLRFAHEWKKNGKWGDDVDLVHWNAGLWDVLELFGDEPLTSLSYYKEAIVRIDRRLRMLFPNAKMVFATSTSVLEEKCTPDFRRHNAVIEVYNKAAVEALSGTDTVINDLYSLSTRLPEEAHSDAVHYYTPLGTEKIGGAVIAVICKLLGICGTEVQIEGFNPESYSVDNIGY